MIAALQRFRFRFHDWVYYSRFPREVSGLLHFLRGKITGSKVAKLERSINAYRFSSLAPIRQPALRVIQEAIPDPVWRDQKVGWPRYSDQLRDPRLSRTVVLKAPGENGEKGAMLLTFEYNWLRLLSGVGDLQKLEEQYDLIFSTSSSPTNYQLLALTVSSLRGTVFVQSCNYSEIPDIEALHPRVKCLATLPCDWIKADLTAPRLFAERDIDILMVANWDLVKRQWQFFEALKSMRRDLRIVMIGQRAGRYDIEFARHAAKLFGARQEIEFHQSLTIDAVADFQSRSKVSTIFSRREGCCVAVAESLFANTPVALLADAHIGPRDYINQQTGVLLERRGKLGHQLQEFLDRANSFEARSWAEANISPEVSARKLNQLLRENAKREQRPWTRDIMTPCWRAHPTLLHNPAVETMRPAYQALHQSEPKVFPVDLIDTSYL